MKKIMSFIVLLTFVVCSTVVFGCTGNDVGPKNSKWPPGQLVVNFDQAIVTMQQQDVCAINYEFRQAPVTTVELRTCFTFQAALTQSIQSPVLSETTNHYPLITEKSYRYRCCDALINTDWTLTNYQDNPFAPHDVGWQG